jgi:hypothetical protein
MKPSQPPPDSLLSRAAEARAEGHGWAAVGQEVGRSPETVRRWPQLYPDRWAAAREAAARRVIEDAAAEGVCTLRQLIRSADDKVRLQAAWHLVYVQLELAKLAQRAAANPPPPSDAQLIAAFVEAHPRDQLIRLAANLLNARVPQRLTLPADEATGGT